MGKIFFISGPSGVGKGTLISALKSHHHEWIFPPSYSTRDMREGESQGNPYYFISKESFEAKVAQGDFLEYALVHQRDWYGTEKNTLLLPVQEGQIVIKEFDVQGFLQIRNRLPKESYISIFLNVHGGVDELVRRIEHRSVMNQKELEKRVLSMQKELDTEPLYDYTVYNDRIDEMVAHVEQIIQKESD